MTDRQRDRQRNSGTDSIVVVSTSFSDSVARRQKKSTCGAALPGSQPAIVSGVVCDTCPGLGRVIAAPLDDRRLEVTRRSRRIRPRGRCPPGWPPGSGGRVAPPGNRDRRSPSCGHGRSLGKARVAVITARRGPTRAIYAPAQRLAGWLAGCSGFNGIFSTNRLYYAPEILIIIIIIIDAKIKVTLSQ